MLKKTLAVAALACLLAGCDPEPVKPVALPTTLDQPHEHPDCPNRDDTSTACR